MTPAIEAILAVGSSWALFTVLKATLVMGLVLCAVLLAGRKRAAFRHMLLAGIFGTLLVLPLVSAVAPAVGIVLRFQPAQNLRAIGGDSRTVLGGRRGGVQRASGTEGRSLSDLLTAAWTAGVALFLVPVVAGLREVRRLRRAATRWPDGQSLADRFAMDAGIRRRVEVLLHPELAGPMTCGVGHPAIVLPADAPGWDAENLGGYYMSELPALPHGFDANGGPAPPRRNALRQGSGFDFQKGTGIHGRGPQGQVSGNGAARRRSRPVRPRCSSPGRARPRPRTR